MVFGDLLLDDVRTYRESAMAPTGIVTSFPLWLHPPRSWLATWSTTGCGR